MRNYVCTKCSKTFEFEINKSLPKEMRVPDNLACPECKEPNTLSQKMEGIMGFDIIGYCYENTHGKHAWKKGKSASDIAAVYADSSINPY